MVNWFLKVGVVLTCMLSTSFAEDSADRNFEVIFKRMELIKGGDILAADIKVKKTGPINFIINGYIEHFKQFDDDWKMVIGMFKGANEKDMKYMMSYPPSGGKGICEFLKKEYKKHFYEVLKDYSNAPHYDTCPLNPAKYTITDYPFDGSYFKKFLSEGLFQLQAKFSHLEESDLIQYDIWFSVEKTK